MEDDAESAAFERGGDGRRRGRRRKDLPVGKFLLIIILGGGDAEPAVGGQVAAGMGFWGREGVGPSTLQTVKRRADFYSAKK